MSYILNISEAILSIKEDCKFAVRGENKSTKQETLDACEIEWFEGTPEISKSDIQTKMNELQVEYDALDKYGGKSMVSDSSLSTSTP